MPIIYYAGDDSRGKTHKSCHDAYKYRMTVKVSRPRRAFRAMTLAEVDPITRTPSWRVPLSELAGEDVFDGIDEEEKDVYAGVSA